MSLSALYTYKITKPEARLGGAFPSPTPKRTEGRTPGWGSE